MEIPRRGGVDWVGDPLADGSFIVTFADTCPSDIYRELALAFALKNGYEVTPALIQMIDRDARAREAQFFAESRARGIAKSIRDLLGAKRKKDVERIAAEVVIDAAEFHDLALNCHMLGLSRHSKFHRFEPEQRLLTAEERAALLASGVTPASLEEEKAVAKVRQLFIEREHRSIRAMSGTAFSSRSTTSRTARTTGRAARTSTSSTTCSTPVGLRKRRFGRRSMSAVMAFRRFTFISATCGRRRAMAR